MKQKKVLNQVVKGLNSFNGSVPVSKGKFLGGDYKISKIYYVPSEDGSETMYELLMFNLLAHHYNGNEFFDYYEAFYYSGLRHGL